MKRYGDRFTADPPGGELDFPDKKAHLAFPALGRPATLEDVREGRAIFSLEGQGEVRVAKLSEFPILARWVTLKDFPIDRDDERRHRSPRVTSKTAGSGRPRKSARGIAGNGSMDSSART